MGGGGSREAQELADSSLWYAAAHGDEERLAELIEDAANVNHRERDQDNATPAIAAATEGLLACLLLLLRVPTCEVDAGDDWGYAPCHYAARQGHGACLQALLDAGAQPDRRAKDGATPAHLAAEHDHVECLAACLAAGADPEARTHAGLSVAAAAAAGGACALLLRERAAAVRDAGHSAVSAEQRPLLEVAA